MRRTWGWARDDRESLVVGLLSRKHRLLAVVPVYVGNVAGTSVRIGELFTEAVRRNASGIRRRGWPEGP